MDTIKQGIILLIKSAITGEKYNLPENFSFEVAEPLIKKNNARQLCIAGAMNCGILEGSACFERIQDEYCVGFIHSERQLTQLNRVFQTFEKNGIDYLPVKGCLMKQLYPSPEIRTMGDADILIREEQYSNIRTIMIDLGFEETIDGSDYDYTWKHPFLKIELHKKLFSDYFADYARYFGDIWERAGKESDFRYSLSREDTFVYYFTHFVKHFRFGGIGCNHAADLWVYKSAYPDMDEAYICREISVLGMDVFYKNLCRMLSAWFEDGNWDEITEIISNQLFDGTWGTKEKYDIAHSVKIIQEENIAVENIRKKQILKLLFPSKESLLLFHPKIAKLPLPIAWIARGCYVMLTDNKKIRKQSQILKNQSEDKVNSRMKELEAMGLKFTK